MPVISSFYGIDIKMYFRDHSPPHFHVFYAERSAEVVIEDLSVLAGSLPSRVLAMVKEWGLLHRDELRVSWEKARSGQPLDRIEPLP